MNYIRIDKCDTANGPGLRVVLWVSGCEHNCPFCHNPETHDPNSGTKADKDTVDEILAALSPDYISGITLSGGDPLYPMNVKFISALVKAIRRKYGESRNIWCYTGYKFEQLVGRDENTDDILKRIDVLVDGRFIKSKFKHDLHWKGSTNQRLIDVKRSSTDNIVLYE